MPFRSSLSFIFVSHTAEQQCSDRFNKNTLRRDSDLKSAKQTNSMTICPKCNKFFNCKKKLWPSDAMSVLEP